MKLKSNEEIAAALKANFNGLSDDRKQELLATIRATHPQKLDQLHSVFTLPPPQGLSDRERGFYDAIVELSGEEPKAVPLSDEELAALPVESQSPDALATLERSVRAMLIVRENALKKAQDDYDALKQKLADIGRLLGNAALTPDASANAKAFVPGAASTPKKPATNGSSN